MTDEETMVLAAIEEHGRPLGDGETFIYFIQREDGGPIKIGRANDPIKRRLGLQCGNPYPLRITRVVVAAGPMDEWQLHQMFAELRMCGEWFQPHPALARMADAIPDESLAEMVWGQVGSGFCFSELGSSD